MELGGWKRMAKLLKRKRDGERESRSSNSWRAGERTIHHRGLKAVSSGDRCPPRPVLDAKARPNIVKGPEKAGT